LFANRLGFSELVKFKDCWAEYLVQLVNYTTAEKYCGLQGTDTLPHFSWAAYLRQWGIVEGLFAFGGERFKVEICS
jgi:hypothetical protein